MVVTRAIALLLAAALASGVQPATAAAPPLPDGPPVHAVRHLAKAAVADDDRVREITIDSEYVTRGKLGAMTLADTQALTSTVLLPKGYDAHPDKRWPLLMLLHGASGSSAGDNSWMTSGNVEQLTADLPAVVLLPEAGVFGMYMNWPGGSDDPPSWEKFHMQQLLTAVEDQYRIRAERRWHAIAGLSMGGQGALRYAAKYPQFFGSVAGFSAAAPDMTSPEIYALFPAIMTQKAGQVVTYEDTYGPLNGPKAIGNSPIKLQENLRHSRVYLASGNGLPCVPEDVTSTFAVDSGTEILLRRQNNEFAASLRAAKIPVKEVRTCGVHNWTIWKRYLQDAMQHWGFFNFVPTAPTTWTYDTTEQTGKAWDVEYAYASPLTQLTRIGRSGLTLKVGGTGPVTLTYRGCEKTLTAPAAIAIGSLCA